MWSAPSGLPDWAAAHRRRPAAAAACPALGSGARANGFAPARLSLPHLLGLAVPLRSPNPSRHLVEVAPQRHDLARGLAARRLEFDHRLALVVSRSKLRKVEDCGRGHCHLE